jgi:hypothetical protein
MIKNRYKILLFLSFFTCLFSIRSENPKEVLDKMEAELKKGNVNRGMEIIVEEYANLSREMDHNSKIPDTIVTGVNALLDRYVFREGGAWLDNAQKNRFARSLRQLEVYDQSQKGNIHWEDLHRKMNAAYEGVIINVSRNTSRTSVDLDHYRQAFLGRYESVRYKGDEATNKAADKYIDNLLKAAFNVLGVKGVFESLISEKLTYLTDAQKAVRVMEALKEKENSLPKEEYRQLLARAVKEIKTVSDHPSFRMGKEATIKFRENQVRMKTLLAKLENKVSPLEISQGSPSALVVAVEKFVETSSLARYKSDAADMKALLDFLDKHSGNFKAGNPESNLRALRVAAAITKYFDKNKTEENRNDVHIIRNGLYHDVMEKAGKDTSLLAEAMMGRLVAAQLAPTSKRMEELFGGSLPKESTQANLDLLEIILNEHSEKLFKNEDKARRLLRLFNNSTEDETQLARKGALFARAAELTPPKQPTLRSMINTLVQSLQAPGGWNAAAKACLFLFAVSLGM